jgi:hypothetical protein
MAQSAVVGTFGDPRRLAGGYLVGPGLNFYTVGTNTINDVAGASNGRWNGSGVIRGFLGVRFMFSGSNHYGFFDVSYDNNPNSASGMLTIHGWAVEDAAETALTTGPTDAAEIPEPGTVATLGLGLLALGAAGIRRKRAQAKQAA